MAAILSVEALPLPSSPVPRPAPGVCHVVAVRSAGAVEPEAYQSVRDGLAPAAQAAGVSVHAWALVPDSLQLCLTLALPARQLPTFFAEIEARVAEGRGGRHGPAFVGWRCVPVAVDTHLFVSHLYIERLPVRQGLALWPWGWRWSSHAANAGGEADACLVPHAAYLQLGVDAAARQRAYRALFELELDPQLWERTEACLDAGRPLATVSRERPA
jgi:putative transposase